VAAPAAAVQAAEAEALLAGFPGASAAEVSLAEVFAEGALAAAAPVAAVQAGAEQVFIEKGNGQWDLIEWGLSSQPEKVCGSISRVPFG